MDIHKRILDIATRTFSEKRNHLIKYSDTVILAEELMEMWSELMHKAGWYHADTWSTGIYLSMTLPQDKGPEFHQFLEYLEEHPQKKELEVKNIHDYPEKQVKFTAEDDSVIFFSINTGSICERLTKKVKREVEIVTYKCK